CLLGIEARPRILDLADEVATAQPTLGVRRRDEVAAARAAEVTLAAADDEPADRAEAGTDTHQRWRHRRDAEAEAGDDADERSTDAASLGIAEHGASDVRTIEIALCDRGVDGDLAWHRVALWRRLGVERGLVRQREQRAQL